MKKVLYFCLSIGLLVSCSDKFEKRSIQEFQLDETIIKHGDSVEVIYCSGAPDFNQELDYYIHMIGVKMDTKDTFNLLTTSLFEVEKDHRYTQFISLEGKASLAADSVSLEVNDMLDKQIDSVISNIKFQIYEENDFPTTIGFLGSAK